MGKDGDPGEGNQTASRDPKMQLAKVRKPDGTSKDFELHRGSDGDVLFTMVSAELSIEEKEYFSLCFYEKTGTRHWLYRDKKIIRQLKGLPWEFSFEVKFYPTTPSTLNDDHARYNLFLQLRNDIFSGRLPATLPTHALLGSLVAQAEFGDHSTSAEYEQYLRTARLAPSMTEQLMDKIKELHKEHKGETPAEAEINYLDACKQLSMYGVFIFNAKDSSNQPISIGICSTGVNIYKETIRLHRFAWQNIMKISYRKNQFAVKLKAGEVENKEVTLVYKVADYAQAKRIWKCGVEHHTFFRLIQPEDKPKSGLFRWGSARFRYQGRTQFQTKMASQMFDRPASATVQRTNSARLTQSCDNVAKEHQTEVGTLGYADNELGSKDQMTSPGISYEVSSNKRAGAAEGKVGDLTLDPDDDELVYTPAIQSPSSAAYYLSEQSSSLRSPYSSLGAAASPHDVRLRETSQRASGARRNLFGRGSELSEDRVRLVSFHEPIIDSSVPLLPTYVSRDLPQIPISDSVQLYNKGYYSSPKKQATTTLRRFFTRDGVSTVEQLDADQDLTQHPIRYFVDVKHSGQRGRYEFSRVVHEGVEERDVLANVSTDYCFPPYGASSLERLERGSELSSTNIRQFSTVYHSGHSTGAEATARPSGIEEAPEVRLIARVATNETDVTTEKSKTHDSSSGLFGFLKSGRKSKATAESSAYPVTDKYEGPLNEVDRQKDLDNMPLENQPHVPYSPKKTAEVSPVEETEHRHFRLITRLRHDGEDEVVEKDAVTPESYGVASTSYDGPLEETSRQGELDTTPIQDHAKVYHSGHSWDHTKLEKTTERVGTPEKTDRKKKAILHLKSPRSTEKTPEIEEAPEVRLIARVATDETDVTTEKSKTHDSSSGLFAFLKSGRKSKATAESSAYPVTDKYQGPLNEVDRQKDLDNMPLENQPHVPYSPKKTADVSPVEETEHRRFRFITRLRHDGEDEVVEKDAVTPESYGVASTSYDGPLEETSRQGELDTTPIQDHAKVYHSGHSWDHTKLEKTTERVGTPEKTDRKKKAILHLKSPRSTDKTPEIEEAPEVRLIARVATDETDVTTEKSKTHDSSSGLFGFLKSGRKSKATAESSAYPVTDKYQGPLNEVDRQKDLDNMPLENQPHVPYSPKKTADVSPVEETEHRRFRLITRLRHDGEDEVVEKDAVTPESYGVASTSYDGPLEETSRQGELDTTPIQDHAKVYHSGHSWDHTKLEKTTERVGTPEKTDRKKKAILHLKSPRSTDKTPEIEEAPEVRLIARVATDETDVTTEKSKTHDSSSGLFGFLKSGRKSKATAESSAYPVTDKYEGPLNEVDRQKDLDNMPLENQPHVPYSPKKMADVSPVEETEHRRFRLITRLRHDGEDEVVEKDAVTPESYGVASTSYDGPLEETSRQGELDTTPIQDHAKVYHSGHSWDHTKLEKTTERVGTPEKTDRKKKAILHLKSPRSTDKTPEIEEAPKVRLIARVATDETDVTTEKGKTHDSSSGLFGFLKSGRKSKATAESSAYPVTDKYEGPLNEVDRQKDLDNMPLENQPHVPYSPKKTADVSPVEETEHRRFRLITRLRHDGEDEVVEKDAVTPESYGVASTSYDGPLEETSRQGELDTTPIQDHAKVYHSGHSWDHTKLEKTTERVGTPEKTDRKKKTILHLKSPRSTDKTPEIEEAPEVRLIARVATDETDVTTEKSKTHDSSSGLFGFLKSGRKSKATAESSAYPVTDKYEGPLNEVDRQKDLDNMPLENQPHVPYSPKKTADVSPVEETEHRRFRLITRLRHDGEDEVVEKDAVTPESYGVASTSYDGPLEETSRQGELDTTPIQDHAKVYHSGHSWDHTKLEKTTERVGTPEKTDRKKKAILHLKSPRSTDKTPEIEEAPEVRLIARVATDETDVTTEKSKTHDSSSGLFGFLKSGRKSKATAESSAYPVTDKYEGPLNEVDRQKDLDNMPLENQPHVPYSPKKMADVSPVEETEHRRFRLITRLRHDGEDEVVEKDAVTPESYGVASTSYDGPLEETSRQGELDTTPIQDHAKVYHSGHSWDHTKLEKTTERVGTPEKTDRKKKAILHLKSPRSTDKTPEIEEAPKVRLIARVATDETDVTTEKSKTHDSSSGLFGFLKSGRKSKATAESSAYPVTDKYEGPLNEVDRQKDLDNMPLENQPHVPYSPKKTADVSPVEETEHRRFRLITRLRHDGEDEVVEKDAVTPESYGVASTSYDGPLEETSRQGELDTTPIQDHAKVYHSGHSWDHTKLEKTTERVGTPEKTDRKKKTILHLKSPRSTDKTPEIEEAPEVRLIARVATDETDVTTEKSKTHDSSSGLFGFLKSGRKSKATAESSAYPVTDKYEGPLNEVDRQKDLDNMPLENQPHVPYSPKKTADVSPVEETEHRRFRFITRLRHDGEDEVVEKDAVTPESYGVASTSYDGPLEETSRQGELDTTPIQDHAKVYHSGHSWDHTKLEKTTERVGTPEKTDRKKKAILHLKSPRSTEKTPEIEEAPEVRLIARVATDETDVTTEKSKTHDSSSGLFGFLKSGRKSKATAESSAYPVTDKYEGPLNEVDRQKDLDNMPLENQPHVPYSPKKMADVSPVEETEHRRFRLITRLRHDGEDEVVEKDAVTPESYGVASTSYDGPLEETSRQGELDTTPIQDHAKVYHSGHSWDHTKLEKTTERVGTPEKTDRKKKAILHLKSPRSTDKTPEIEEAPKVRLIARVATDETDVTTEKSKTHDSSSGLFGFLKSGRKSKATAESSAYPVTDKYEGPLNEVDRQKDLDNMPLENQPHVPYSPKKTADVSPVEETEHRRFRLITRLRHDGEDEVVEKDAVTPESYGVASTSYDGPLEETSRQGELDTTPIQDHAKVYHSGHSWDHTKLEKTTERVGTPEKTDRKKKAILHLKSPRSTDKTPEIEEAPEVRLIARVATDETDVTTEKSKTHDSSSGLFGFLKSGRKSKATAESSAYPVTDKYEGPLNEVDRQKDLDNMPLENQPHVPYSPKKTADVSPVEETEHRRFRLITRLRHDGEDEVVEKDAVTPESYGVASTSYDGPLEETSRQGELNTTPIQDHAKVYHSGHSWDHTKLEKTTERVGTPEKTDRKKKAILHLKSPRSTDKTPEIEEAPEVRLIARVATDETDVTTEKSKTHDTSSGLFGFLKSGRKSKATAESSAYPVTDKYQGPLNEVDRQKDLDNMPLENQPHVPYSPKKTADVSPVEETEHRRFRLITHLRHDGEDEVVEKDAVTPESYGVASTSYDGPLEETSRQGELDTTPIQDHAKVYHSGHSWDHTELEKTTERVGTPEKTDRKKKAILHLKSPRSTDKTPEIEEAPEVRLIARVATDETDVTTDKSKTHDSSSGLFGFLKSGRKSKATAESSAYPVTDKYEGPLNEVDRQKDLDNMPLENQPHVPYSPKKTADVSPVEETEHRRFRLITRLRHDGEDEVVEKDAVTPESYGVASTSYDGPLEETSRQGELDTTPIQDHAKVYHSGHSWDHTELEKTTERVGTPEKTDRKKKAILHLKSPRSTDKTPEIEEAPEVRLIARVATDETDVTTDKSKTHDSSSGLFGFLKSGRKSKATAESSAYPVTDKYEGPLNEVDRQKDLDNMPLENQPHVPYSPKKTADVSPVEETEHRRFRLITRLRHDGEDEVVEKDAVTPESYGVASTSYDGPLEETSRQGELDTTPIQDHAKVYHSGHSWDHTELEKTTERVGTPEKTDRKKKAILHLKSPRSTDKTPEIEEAPEVRLIARVATDETDVTTEKSKTHDSSSGLFGFLKSGRKSKATAESSAYPVTDKYEGPLNEVDRQKDLDNMPLENQPHVPYSPKKTADVSPVEETEHRRFRLITRLRHDGEDEVVEKDAVTPESYGVASTSYDGPLEETSRQGELDTTPIQDHAKVYHSGHSWDHTKLENSTERVGTPEKTDRKKKAILHLKSPRSTDKTPEIEEAPEVRLIARVATDETDVTTEKSKTHDSSSGLFGFLKSGRKSKATAESSAYPVTDKYEGPLNEVDRQKDLDNMPLENQPHVPYSPKKTADVSPVEETEHRRFRLITRLRHDGEDEVVEKDAVTPESYGVASTSYDGPLEETSRQGELDTTPIQDHAKVYHSGHSWDHTKLENSTERVGTPEKTDRKKKAILHLKSPRSTDKTPEIEEAPEVRLIARVATDETDVTTEKSKTHDSSSGLFGFLKSGRKSKATAESSAYPVTDKYQGPLNEVDRQKDLDNMPLENQPHVPYSPKKTADVSPVEETEHRRFRLITRLRHDGEDEVVEKDAVTPESYGVASTSYDGPLEETSRQGELDTTPIQDHAKVYHSGHSWDHTKLEKTTERVGTPEKTDRKKKAILHLKSPRSTDKTPEIEEAPEVRLIARVATDETDVTTEKSKTHDSSSGLFGFLKSGRKSKATTESSAYPVTDKYEGPLNEVDRQKDLDNMPLENQPHVPYSPKKMADVSPVEETEHRRFRLITRLRHDGEDEVVEKDAVTPESYGVASTSYDGPLEETSRQGELDTTPIQDHAKVYHSGHSWDHTKLEKTTERVGTPEKTDRKKKAILHLKSPRSTDKTPEIEEAPKVRLIARVATDETDVTTEKSKTHDSSSGLLGFLKSGRKSKATAESSAYPVTDKYEGPLNEVDRQKDLDNMPLENQPHVPYSPKKTADVSPVEETEHRRFRLITRLRHDGEDEVVEKDAVTPESYGVASTSYDGPLEETSRQGELDTTPIQDHAKVYHSGHSWDHTELEKTTERVGTPEKTDRKKKAILHLKSPRSTDKTPEIEEAPEVRLIARVATDETDVTTEKSKTHDSSSGLFGFLKSGRKSKATAESSAYPVTDKYEGPLNEVDRQKDLDNMPLENQPHVPYSPKKTADVSPVEETEHRRFRFITRLRHDGEDEVVEKDAVTPESYGVASTSYDGPLEETSRQGELDTTPIQDHAKVYHSGHSWDHTKLEKTTERVGTPEKTDRKKKAILHLKSPRSMDKTPEIEEAPEVRLIARVATDETDVTTEKSKTHDSSSGLFGFLKSGRKSKATAESSAYPVTDKYEGPLNEVDRQKDLDNMPLENQPHVPYSPKKMADVSPVEETEHRRFRLITRLRHDGEDEVVEKDAVTPESYGVASTFYDGPLEETSRQGELDTTPIQDHAKVYHSGHSWDHTKLEKTTERVGTPEKTDRKKKAILHLKSPRSTDKTPEIEEAPEVRLIARVATDETDVTTEKSKTHDSSSGLFGFLKSGRKSKATAESSAYPVTDKYEGPLNEVDRQKDLDNMPLENQPHVPYSPKKMADVSPVEETEHRHFRLITRLRHDGEDEVVEKDAVTPESYGVASTSYDGPLEETSRQGELDTTPIQDHAKVYHSGHSWDHTKLEKTTERVGTPEKTDRKKKAILHLKSPRSTEKTPEIEEAPEVRLIARVATDETDVTTEKSKTHDSSSGLFGFLKSGRKSKATAESSAYPVTDKYEGPLNEVDRQKDLDNMPLENQPHVPYSPKKTADVSPVEETEHRRFRFITRLRHDGEDEVVEKDAVTPESYGVASISYDGPLEETSRRGELDTTPIQDHAKVYHSGHSWDHTKLEKTTERVGTPEKTDRKKKAILHLKSPRSTEKTPEIEEAPEVRLIARVTTDETDVTTEKSKTHDSSSGLFGFLKSGRKSKATAESSAYPVTDKYEGPLNEVDRQKDLDNMPLENQPHVPYSPKKTADVSPVEETEHRRFRFITRLRHDGEDEVVEKDAVTPESYGVASTSYDGPLEETSRQGELDTTPIQDHAKVYHSGHSWDHTKLEKTTERVGTPEKTDRKKKAILHLKSPRSMDKTPEIEEAPEVRLIARVATDETDVTTEKSKTHDSSSGLFGFLKSGRKSKATAESSAYPVTDKYEGPLNEVDRQKDLDNMPLENQPHVPYSPKKMADVSPVEETEHRRFRLITRLRHDGEDEVVEKDAVTPESYGVASTFYDGPLEETSRQGELDTTPIQDHAKVYHSGHSWDHTKLEKTTERVGTPEKTDRKKKAILHLKSPRSTDKTPEIEEAPEVRLIARVATDETDVTTEKSKTHDSSSGLFGFLKSGRKSKATAESSAYPVTDKYEGPLNEVDRQKDLDNMPLENQPHVPYSPKKMADVSPVEETEHRHFRLITRLRHDGEDEVVEKDAVTPESYGVASTSYDGPLEETSRQGELDTTPIQDHAKVYHSGHSWDHTKLEKTTERVGTPEKTDRKKKAILHLKSPRSTDKTPEIEEAPEVRLIARVATDETDVTTEKSKTHDSSSGLFGFLKSGRKSKATAESSAYPVTDKYEGPLNEVDRQKDLDNMPLENQPHVPYSPKKMADVSPVEETEHRRFRLITRLRHDGEDEVVEKDAVTPESYGVASTSYDGPLEETSRQGELDTTPIQDHAKVYHSGHSWDHTKLEKTTERVGTPEKTDRKKKAILHLKSPRSTEKTPEIEEAPEVRLIARVATDETDVTTEKSKTHDSSSGLFGFLKSGRKSKATAESSAYPVTDKYEGPLNEVDRQKELENKPLPEISPDNVEKSTKHVEFRRPLSTHDSNRQSCSSYHAEGTTSDGQQWIEVRVERRVEVQLEPIYALTAGVGLGAVSEDEGGLIFSATPPPMAPPGRSLLSRLGFKGKKSKKSKKGVKEADSSNSSDSDDEKQMVATLPRVEHDSARRTPPSQLISADQAGTLVRHETKHLHYHLKGEGVSPGFDPQRPESGQPHMTVDSWQETSNMPDDVTIEYDEHGNKITRTIKTSQVKHTVQKQTFQNYVVPDENEPEVASIERIREQATPLGVSAEMGGPMMETHTRTMEYQNTPAYAQNDELGEFVSSKTVTTGNRTVETITYKTERDGIVETHVEHRVTIHSEATIDHDAELSQAILEATQMNPDMTVEKIEVRQETTA